MLKKEVTVKNKQGFHLRPATMIAKIARDAASSVYLSNGGIETDCTDVLDLLSLEAHAGSVLFPSTARMNRSLWIPSSTSSNVGLTRSDSFDRRFFHFHNPFDCSLRTFKNFA